MDFLWEGFHMIFQQSIERGLTAYNGRGGRSEEYCRVLWENRQVFLRLNQNLPTPPPFQAMKNDRSLRMITNETLGVKGFMGKGAS